MTSPRKELLLKVLFKAKIEDPQHAIWIIRFISVFFYVMAILQWIGALVPSQPTDIPTSLFYPGIDGPLFWGLAILWHRFKKDSLSYALILWTGLALLKYILGAIGLLAPQSGQWLLQISLFVFALQGTYAVKCFHATRKS